MAITKKIAAAAAAVTLVFSFAAEAAETLRVGSMTVYPPFEFLDSNTGKYEGFDMDLIREIGKRNGYDVEIVSMGLDGLIPALMSGNIDCAISGLTITPERSEKVDFTRPYMNAGLTVMTTRENAPKIKSLKDLEGKTLCAEIGSSGALMMKRIPNTLIRTFNSAGDAFLELNKGGCYAMLNDGPVNRYFLHQKASKGMRLVALDFVVSDDFYGMAVQKGNKKLLKVLEDSLTAMEKDGTYQKIYDRWFGATE
ncbi:basic amino acid ABC transporter substrate-binding protein [Sutterella sp.]|uniref:basic amino acid ABC transporter substrate-binding protein n=1 Tax=Sutterella sp. TaxID=1981025 RepID=UPI0026DF5711|nr:basic amino acid ABC transporter substrate-binding protein [Sutterella sp.]MDO5532689.1 basic amino acid ABC transporter substrate-binding protein [Sutterella sp.]